jgi:hypothetical protein
LVSELVPRASLTERGWEIAAPIDRNAPLALRDYPKLLSN